MIVVSHDRHFLNTICTHIVDIDYNKIKMYVGNYDFWYDASQLMQNLMKNQNKKNEEKAQELKEFISRFSANKSKSKQATARRKLLEKITLEEIPASSRRYPWVAFSPRPGGGQGHPLRHRRQQDHRRGEGAGQGELHRGPRGQDRLRGRQRERPHRPVPDPHRRDGARRGHRQVGPDRHLLLLPQGQHPVLPGLRRQPGGVAAPVVFRPPRGLSPGLFGPDALLRGRGVQAGEGALPAARRCGACSPA